MGRDKALLPIDGRAMALRVADALWSAGAAEVVAQGGDPDALASLGMLVRQDREPGGGPLPATLQALDETVRDIVVVLSCDLLHPAPAVIGSLVAALRGAPDVGAAVPRSDGELQWTHAAWRRWAAEGLRAAQAEGARSLRRAAGGLDLLEVTGIDPTALADADLPSDLGG